jgi:hypothetical protein
MPKPYTNAQRGLALKRAKKFEKLFKNSIFDEIVTAAENKNEAAFRAAVKPPVLDPKEADWLWNYLQNCDSKFYSSVPEAAAATGW